MDSYRKTLNAAGIASYIEKQIQSGDLKPGTALPTVRDLAIKMSVNPSTVAAAYKSLRAAGMIVTNGRKGSKVAPPPAQIDLSVSFPTGLEDFASGNVDICLLPQADVNFLQQQVTQIGYEANRDDETLETLSKTWLTEQHIPHERIGFFSGTLDAMERILRQRIRPGASVLIEDPCWPPVIALLKNLHLKAVPLEMDEEGCLLPPDNVDASAVILTLRAHNPTGISMSPERFEDWKRYLDGQPNMTLIMDDYWALLSEEPLPDLEENLPQNWFYLMSFSKALGPDLRLCLATGNGRFMAELRQHQLAGPRWVSLTLQRLTAHLWQIMQDGNRFPDVIRSYQARRQQFVDSMRANGFEIPQREGLHFWLPVRDETAALQSLASHGAAIQSGENFRIRTPKSIRISIANMHPHNIEQLVDWLIVAKQAYPNTPI